MSKLRETRTQNTDLCHLAHGGWPCKVGEEVMQVVHVLHLLERPRVTKHIKELVEPWDLVDASPDFVESLWVTEEISALIHAQAQNHAVVLQCSDCLERHAQKRVHVCVCVCVCVWCVRTCTCTCVCVCVCM